MRFVADDPRGPTTQDRAELLPGIRSFHIKHVRGKHGVKAPVHVLYFRCADVGTIEVVRVLHERIEPSRHVCEPEVQRRPKRRRRRKLR
jgi:toxin ParE1/3/4